MHGGLAGGDQLLSDSNGNWQIRKAVSVEVSNLATSYVKENHATPVNIHSNIRPRSDFLLNLSDDGVRSHWLWKFDGRENDAFFRRTMLAGRR